MTRRLPPLNALVVFETAARHLSFTRAADSLHVTQAAVSHQIKALEEWLGATLFHRLGRGHGLVLTEAGRHYLPRVRAAFDIIRESTAAIDTARKRVLAVKTLDSFGYHWLVPRLRGYSQRFPNVDVRLVSSDLEDDALSKGAVDLDIRYGDGDWADVESVRFLTETVFPVCSPSIITVTTPLRTLEDLRHHTLLHDVMVTDWRGWLESAGISGIDAERGPGFNHSHLVTQAAIHGAGVALGRSALVVDALRRGELVRPFSLSIPSRYSYFVVCSRGAVRDPVVAGFRDWLIAEGASSQQDLNLLDNDPLKAEPSPT
ncbi:MAG TPA: transcriptional regulator GcvA [Steroidobacteraceae bacterium]|nr:transcriptional regulator GcvA [Steroidobacteraceae bacterium]